MTCEPWPVVWPCDPLPEVSSVQLEAALQAAQSMLWSRTGRRLGTCTVVERYRTGGRGGECGRPYLTDDLVWHNGGRGGPCCALHLWNSPVQEIVEVKVHGVVLPSTGWWFEQPGRLMRAGECWPVMLECDPPAIEVTYTWGVPLTAPVDAIAEVVADPAADPPVIGSPAVVEVVASPLWGLAAGAMGEVATEVLNGMCGRACKLPGRAVTVTRQGVTVQLTDPATNVEQMLLGLPLSDALILSVNPGRKQQQSRVYSPDTGARV